MLSQELERFKMSEETEIRKIIQRIPARLHEKAKKSAKAAGMSLNSYINKLIEMDESDDRKRLETLEKELNELAIEFWHFADRTDKRLNDVEPYNGFDD